MPKHYESSAALCPFYRMEEKTVIWCEGPSDSVMRLLYEQEDTTEKQKTQFCYHTWTNCPIARMLWAQYADPSELSRFSVPRAFLQGR